MLGKKTEHVLAFHGISTPSFLHQLVLIKWGVQVLALEGSSSGEAQLCQYLCYPQLLLQCARLHQVGFPRRSVDKCMTGSDINHT